MVVGDLSFYVNASYNLLNKSTGSVEDPQKRVKVSVPDRCQNGCQRLWLVSIAEERQADKQRLEARLCVCF